MKLARHVLYRKGDPVFGRRRNVMNMRTARYFPKSESRVKEYTSAGDMDCLL